MRLYYYFTERQYIIHNFTPRYMLHLNGNTLTVLKFGVQGDISNIFNFSGISGANNARKGKLNLCFRWNMLVTYLLISIKKGMKCIRWSWRRMGSCFFILPYYTWTLTNLIINTNIRINFFYMNRLKWSMVIQCQYLKRQLKNRMIYNCLILKKIIVIYLKGIQLIQQESQC